MKKKAEIWGIPKLISTGQHRYDVLSPRFYYDGGVDISNRFLPSGWYIRRKDIEIIKKVHSQTMQHLSLRVKLP